MHVGASGTRNAAATFFRERNAKATQQSRPGAKKGGEKAGEGRSAHAPGRRLASARSDAGQGQDHQRRRTEAQVVVDRAPPRPRVAEPPELARSGATTACG